MAAIAPPNSEALVRFDCFGDTCTVVVEGGGPGGTAPVAAGRAQRRMLEWHDRFSRFQRGSELSRLNHDGRETVPVSAMMARFVEAAVHAAEMTGGLVDPTLVSEIEQAGYAEDLDSLPASATIASAGAAPAGVAPAGVAPTGVAPAGVPARPAGPHPSARWREIHVDRRAGTVTRPVGVQLDSGGVAKGLFGDVLASLLSLHRSFAIGAAGDVRVGGAAGLPRPVQVSSPFSDEVLHTFALARGAVATSGTTKRRWLDDRGHVAHHLLDPATGTPAFTGVLQATALARSGMEAEALAKAALLSGAESATDWLWHGGVVVYDDGSCDVAEPAAVES